MSLRRKAGFGSETKSGRPLELPVILALCQIHGPRQQFHKVPSERVRNGFRSLRFPKRIRFIEKGKIIAGSNERLWSLPLPDPDDKAPGFAQTKRERNEVGVARNQAVSVDPDIAEHVDCSDREFDVRGVLACRGLGTTHWLNGMPNQSLDPSPFLKHPECSAHHDLAMFRSDIEDLRDPGGGDVPGVDQERETPARLDDSGRCGVSIRTRVVVLWVLVRDEGSSWNNRRNPSPYWVAKRRDYPGWRHVQRCGGPARGGPEWILPGCARTAMEPVGCRAELCSKGACG